MPGVGSGPISMAWTPAATNPASSADSNMYPERRVSLPMSTVPPCGASTRAAALASLSAKSTVIGCSPTRPRTPSVPKYRRPMSISICALNGGGHLQGIDRRRHIVSADDACTLERGEDRERHAAVHALSRLPPCQCADRRLARQPDQQRRAVGGELPEVPQQCQIVLQVLAETEAGVDGESVSLDPRAATGCNAGGQKRAHLVHHVGVVRRDLHGAGLALHVHETHGAAARRGRLQSPGATQSPHVVDEAGAPCRGSTHHLG